MADLATMEVQPFLTNAAGTLAPEAVGDLRVRVPVSLTLAENWDWAAKGANPAVGKMRMPPRSHVLKRPITTEQEFQRLVLAVPQPIVEGAS